jgi:hypothetical protein
MTFLGAITNPLHDTKKTLDLAGLVLCTTILQEAQTASRDR